MSLHSPPTDPFQLERLAEELESRELVHPSSTSNDLPLFIPLSHDNPYLTKDTFHVDEFLISRLYTSLPDLRAELRDYLSTLKEELVKLINDDYEAFISLSTDLRGEGARLERLNHPLGNIKLQILESKQELQAIQGAIQGKLQKRAILREEKALLHLLLKISESVTRLESLLLIAAPEQDTTSSPNDLKLPLHLGAEQDDTDDSARGNRAKHLARVAAEYTQLLYHVSKARLDKCAFVDEIQWRVDRIQSTLSSDLDHLFAATVGALSGDKREKEAGRATEVEKAKWTADLTECLRTYDVLGLWSDAEDVLRREIMREFVKKTIFPGALAAPHSPIVPHTPFPPMAKSALSPGPLTAARTPYTPYAAFASKQLPSHSLHAHFLDDADDALARLYNQVLRFVERDLGRIMEVAERVTVKGKTVSDKGGGEGFDIMANVVWAELGRAIMDELGGVVFAAGRPDEFRKHHETTQAFIRSLECLAPSAHAVQSMRTHYVYHAFERRWQLPVYFQLRWKEIVGKLEDALAVTRIEPSKDNAPFVTAQAVAIWVAISTCWSAEVYIPDLSHRFWKFTLQLLSRYKVWMDNSLPALETAQKSVVSAAAPDRIPGSPSSLSRASTPIPPAEATTAESNAADTASLRLFAAAIVDIRAMNSQVLTLWREEISMMLPDTGDIEQSDDVKPEDALKQTLAKATSLIPTLSSQIIAILTRRCCDALLPVRSVPSQFRAMANKRPPTEPSYFVSSILRPIKSFFAIGSDGPGSDLREDFLKTYAEEVFESVCQRYVYYLTAMKKTEESLRRLKKGKKSAFSLFGSSNTVKDDEGRDEERIRTQSILDVNAFGKDAESLGVDVLARETFKTLQDMVHASLIDDT